MNRMVALRFDFRFSLWAATALILLASPGCSMTRARPLWVQNMVFWEEEDKDERYAKETPAMRLDALREQSKTLPNLPEAEHVAVAQKLAQEYRNEADALVRCHQVRAIAQCRSPLAAETLEAALSDSDRDVRIAACDSWGVHGGPKAAAQLSIALRKDSDSDVRLAAARALGKVGGQESIAALAPALEDPDPAMQYRAVQSLRQISGKDFGDDANAWREFTRGGNPAEISTVQRMKLNFF